MNRDESKDVPALISSQPHVGLLPVVMQSLSVNSSGEAAFVHWSHELRAEAPLAPIMPNAKIAAKAIPII
jgi:hypothetical protein